MLADRLRDRHENHAGLFQLFLEGCGHRNRIEHRIDRNTRPRAVATLDAGQDFLFAQWNAELLVGAQNFRIDLVERLQRRSFSARSNSSSLDNRSSDS